MNAAEQRDIERQIEPAPVSLEVLVELAPRGVDRLRRAQHAHAEGAGEALELPLGLGVVGDAAETALGRRDEQAADGRVDEVVGDVEQVLARGGVSEAPIELGGDGVHGCSFLRSLRMPDEAAWRAAVAFEPSAAPMSA